MSILTAVVSAALAASASADPMLALNPSAEDARGTLRQVEASLARAKR